MTTVKPEAAMMPPAIQETRPHSATEQLLARAAASLAEHGATPEQTAVMAELNRIVGEVGDPAVCLDLNGQCVSHQQDHDDLIHRGTEWNISAGGTDGLLSAQLVKWGQDEPHIVFGNNAAELDIAATDALLSQLESYTVALLKARRHLVAAVHRHRLDNGIPLAEIVSAECATEQVTA